MTTAIAEHPDILSDEEAKHYSQQYETPPEVIQFALNFIARYGITGFDLDVAASTRNKKAWFYYGGFSEDHDCLGDDGLTGPWDVNKHKAWWCNPPFKQIHAFLSKGYEEAKRGNFGVALAQWDHTTDWYARAKSHATAIIPLEGKRVNFIHHPKLLAHLKAQGKKPSGNNGGNALWIYNPHMLDLPNGAPILTNTGNWWQSLDYLEVLA